MFDTHCHPQYHKYDDDREAMLQRSFDADVNVICVGTDLEESKKAIALAAQYPGKMWATVGLHPNDNLDEVYDQSEYQKLAQNPIVVAIGEIGLDYYRTPDVEQQKIQKQRFLEQISLALELSKPVVIHCREAHHDMFEILEQNSDLRGVIHSFTGTLEEAKRYMELGFYLGINGIVTFSKELAAVVTEIPLEKILLETDAPFLTPVPHRGQRNEPAYVKFVAQKIAEIRNITIEEVSSITTQNAIELFGIHQ